MTAISKKVFLLFLLLGLVSSVSAIKKTDGFEDGDFLTPNWTESQAGGSSSVQTSTVLEGTYSAKLTTSGSGAETMTHDRGTSDNISDGDTYISIIKPGQTDGRVSYTLTNDPSNPLGSDQIGFFFNANGNIFAQTRDSSGNIISGKDFASYNAGTSYRVEIEIYTSNSTAYFTAYYNSNGTKINSTSLSTSGASNIQYVHLEVGDVSSGGGTGYFDNVSYSTTSQTSKSISIGTYPRSKNVFVRNATGVGSTGWAEINISGTYSGSPDCIQVQWLNNAWKNLTCSPSGGSFSGTFLAKGKGYGQVSVRFSNNTSVNDSRSEIGVGDSFLLYGQSNMQMIGNNLNTYDTTSEINATFWNPSTNQFELANDDFENLGYGSSFPNLAEKIVANRSVPVEFVTCPQGGESIQRLMEGSGTGYYQNCIDRLNNASTGSMKVTQWWWMQGEYPDALTDYQDGGTGQPVTGTYQDYYSNLTELIQDAHADTNELKPFMIGQIGVNRTDRNDLNEIRQAQLDLAQNSSDSISACQGPVTYNVSTANDKEVHWKTDAQLAAIGERYWDSLKSCVYGYPNNRSDIQSIVSPDNQTINFIFDEKLDTSVNLGIEAFRITDESGTILSKSSIGYKNSTTVQINLSSKASTLGTASLGFEADAIGKNIPLSSKGDYVANTFVSNDISTDSAPLVTIDSPENQTYSSSSIDLNVTSDEAANFTYNVDGGSNTTVNEGDTDLNTTLTGLSDGRHTVNVWATDSAGNTGYANKSFTVGNITIHELSASPAKGDASKDEKGWMYGDYVNITYNFSTINSVEWANLTVLENGSQISHVNLSNKSDTLVDHFFVDERSVWYNVTLTVEDVNGNTETVEIADDVKDVVGRTNYDLSGYDGATFNDTKFGGFGYYPQSDNDDVPSENETVVDRGLLINGSSLNFTGKGWGICTLGTDIDNYPLSGGNTCQFSAEWYVDGPGTYNISEVVYEKNGPSYVNSAIFTVQQASISKKSVVSTEVIDSYIVKPNTTISPIVNEKIELENTGNIKGSKIMNFNPKFAASSVYRITSNTTSSNIHKNADSTLSSNDGSIVNVTYNGSTYSNRNLTINVNDDEYAGSVEKGYYRLQIDNGSSKGAWTICKIDGNTTDILFKDGNKIDDRYIEDSSQNEEKVKFTLCTNQESTESWIELDKFNIKRTDRLYVFNSSSSSINFTSGVINKSSTSLVNIRYRVKNAVNVDVFDKSTNDKLVKEFNITSSLSDKGVHVPKNKIFVKESVPESIDETDISFYRYDGSKFVSISNTVYLYDFDGDGEASQVGFYVPNQLSSETYQLSIPKTSSSGGDDGNGGTQPSTDSQTVYFGQVQTTDGIETFNVQFGTETTRNLTITNNFKGGLKARLEVGSNPVCQYISVRKSLNSDQFAKSGSYSVPAAKVNNLGTLQESTVETTIKFDLPNKTVLKNAGVTNYTCSFSTTSSYGKAEPLKLKIEQAFSLVRLLKKWNLVQPYKFKTGSLTGNLTSSQLETGERFSILIPTPVSGVILTILALFGFVGVKRKWF